MDIIYYIAENSYNKSKEFTISMFLLFPSVFCNYLKRNWNVLEIHILPKCMYSQTNINYIMHILVSDLLS